MTDADSGHVEEDEVSPREGALKHADLGRQTTLIVVVVGIVVIVLILLMVRGCGSVLTSTSSTGSTKEIVPVEGLKPVDGAVSVWLAAGTDLQATLAAAGVQSSGVIDMSAGRFIVSVPEGTEVEAVRVLKNAGGVYDAGRVYSDETTAKP